MTEYSGFKYAIFFLAEYFGMFAVSGLAVTLFLGGWHAPLRVLEFVPSYLWFFLKLGVLLFVFIWIRGTLPRIRVDQMMSFAWKFMLPMAFACILAAAVWHYAGHRLAGWFWSLVVVAAGLSHALASSRDRKEIRPAHLSFCRMNSAAFFLIAIAHPRRPPSPPPRFRQLIHAALSFAVALVGVAALLLFVRRGICRPGPDLCLCRRGRGPDRFHHSAHAPRAGGTIAVSTGAGR